MFEDLKNNEGRNSTIDILKGLGMVCVVLGHCTISKSISNFVNLFHMAIFIIASGYFFNPKKINSFKRLILVVKRKIKTLWIPYVVCNGIFLFLNNFFIKVHIYVNVVDNVQVHNYFETRDFIQELVKILFFFGGTELGGATWFLRTLFGVYIMYCVVQFIIQKFFPNEGIENIVQGIVALLFVFIGWKELFPVHTINQIFSLYCIFWLGINIRKITEIVKSKQIKMVDYYAGMLISFTILNILQNKIGTISINGNQYKSPTYLLLTSILGWIFLFSIAIVINKCKCLAYAIRTIGEHSLSVLLLHFLAFKIVTLLQIIIYDYDICALGTFATLKNGVGWSFLYLVVGIYIPVLLDILIKKMLYNIRNKYFDNINDKADCKDER